MKRFTAWILTVCFLLAAGCAAALDGTDGEDASSLPEPTTQSGPAGQPEGEDDPQPDLPAEPASGTDTVVPEGMPEITGEGSATDIPASPAPVDLTALSVEECVTDTPVPAGTLPWIALDCPGAEAINGAIEAEFSEPAGEADHLMYYEATKSAGDVLSVLLVDKTPMNDVVVYGVYNLDLASGLALSGAELLEKLDVDPAYLVQLEQALLGEEFTYLYGQFDTGDDEFYTGQYDRTTDPANAETDRIWIGQDGQLQFIGRIYSMAGAEYYEYPLATGLFF